MLQEGKQAEEKEEETERARAGSQRCQRAIAMEAAHSMR